MRGVKRDALTRSYTLENHTPPNGRRFKCLFGHNSFATSHGFTFSCASRLSTTSPPPHRPDTMASEQQKGTFAVKVGLAQVRYFSPLARTPMAILRTKPSRDRKFRRFGCRS